MPVDARDRRHRRERVGDSFAQARPAARWPATRSCSWSRSGSVLTTLLFVQDLGDADARRRTSFAGLVVGVALVHGAVRQLRRGDGRGPRQGPGRHAAQDARRDRRPACAARTARSRSVPRSTLAVGDLVRRRRPARSIPGDGEVDRGHRLRRRVGDHRRVGPGHPRVRRRPLGRHRRHAGALRPDRRARSPPEPGETFLDRMIALVEGAEPAEDAERDRAHHPARRA